MRRTCYCRCVCELIRATKIVLPQQCHIGCLMTWKRRVEKTRFALFQLRGDFSNEKKKRQFSSGVGDVVFPSHNILINYCNPHTFLYASIYQEIIHYIICFCINIFHIKCIIPNHLINQYYTMPLIRVEVVKIPLGIQWKPNHKQSHTLLIFIRIHLTVSVCHYVCSYSSKHVQKDFSWTDLNLT